MNFGIICIPFSLARRVFSDILAMTYVSDVSSAMLVAMLLAAANKNIVSLAIVMIVLVLLT